MLIRLAMLADGHARIRLDQLERLVAHASLAATGGAGRGALAASCRAGRPGATAAAAAPAGCRRPPGAFCRSIERQAFVRRSQLDAYLFLRLKLGACKLLSLASDGLSSRSTACHLSVMRYQ